jgi:hypothetical protein
MINKKKSLKKTAKNQTTDKKKTAPKTTKHMDII